VIAKGVDKVYDGTTAATVTLSDDRLPGDALTMSYADARFADANAGPGKMVTVSGLTIAGDDSANYTLASTTVVTTASISKATAGVSLSDLSWLYDGTAHDARATRRRPGCRSTWCIARAASSSRNRSRPAVTR
jgi:hypothetical protein